jgi:hypothetical protein
MKVKQGGKNKGEKKGRRKNGTENSRIGGRRRWKLKKLRGVGGEELKMEERRNSTHSHCRVMTLFCSCVVTVQWLTSYVESITTDRTRNSVRML